MGAVLTMVRLRVVRDGRRGRAALAPTSHGPRGRRNPRRVGRLVGCPLEEVVLQRVERSDAILGVIIQHAQDKVLQT